MLLLTVAAHAEEPTRVKPSLVVVPVRVKGGPDLTKDTKTQLEAPLGRAATLVSLDTYRRAVLASGHMAKDLADPTVMRTVGPTVGATHIVVVASVAASETDDGKVVSANVVEVSLVALATGETLYTTKRTLSSPRMTRTVSAPIVAVLTGVLANAVVAPPAVAAAPPTPPLVEPPVPAAVATVPVPPQVPATLPVAPVPPPPDNAAVRPEPAPPVAAAITDTALDAPIIVAPARPSRQVDLHPTVDARFGLLMLARDGRINAAGGTASYDGAVAAPALSISFFPWARRAAGAWERGVGLYGEGYLTTASADFGASSTSSAAAVGGFDLGGAYRFAPMKSARAPVVTLQLGYGYASFPISAAPFPGISYSSLELGFVVDFPIAAHVAGFAGGRVFPWMSAGGGSDRLGNADSLYALRGDAGLRVVFGPLSVIAAGRLQQYSGSFSGVTDLRLASELQNVDFTDRYYGGSLSGGYSF